MVDATKTIRMSRAQTDFQELWLNVWFVASAIAGFVAGGNMFRQVSEGAFGTETSFGALGAFGVAAAVSIGNIPVMIIARMLFSIFREQVAIMSYVRATAEMQAGAKG